MKRESTYNYNMNILRGIATILVVLGHSIFIDMIRMYDLRKEQSHYLNLFIFIYKFHMPLFFFISGFFGKKVFDIKNKEQYKNFIKEKTCRLMIPYLTFSCLGLISKLAMSSKASNPVDIKRVIFEIFFNPWENPLSLLWFVYTLYLIFALLPLFNKVDNKVKILGLTVVWCILSEYKLIFNIDGVVRYSLFFILGYEFYRNYDKYLKSNKNIIRPIILFSILILINTGLMREIGEGKF